MMKAEHTPGPWKAIGSPYSDRARDVIAPNGDRIAAVNGAAFDYSSEIAANARLIASAPDLLAALEQCLPIVDAYRRIALGEGDIAAHNARHAIAKAKGIE